MVAYNIAVFGGVLVVCVLVCTSIVPTKGERVWKCSGKPTRYTYKDCESDRSMRDGCYYLVHFEQYRPCGDICEGVEMWSIDEQRCRSLCPAFLDNFCEPESTKQQLLPTALMWRHCAASMTQQVLSPSTTPVQLSIASVLLTATTAAVLAIVLSAIISHFSRKCQQRCSETGGEMLNQDKTSTATMTETSKNMDNQKTLIDSANILDNSSNEMKYMNNDYCNRDMRCSQVVSTLLCCDGSGCR